MQGNIIGQSGMFVNDSLFPIYQQLNQPIEYNGIWIKTEDNLKDVYFQTDDVRDYELINDLPYIFRYGRVTSIGSDIYLFGGEEGEDLSRKAYKYNSVEETYTELTTIPGNFENGVLAATNSEIYLAYMGLTSSYGYVLSKYNPSTDTYTSILSNNFHTAVNGSMAIVDNFAYIFGSSKDGDEKTAYKCNLSTSELTKLKDIPELFYSGSAVAINENEIMLLGVGSDSTSHGAYKYNVTENAYYKDKGMIGTVPANAKINYFAYILERAYPNGGAYYGPILTKYGLKNNSIYQYGKSCVSLEGNSYDTFQVANANNDLYILTDLKLHKAKIVADYKGDGIYVISQETSLSKDLDVKNVLDVKKIVDGEEQDILVYIGDGTSWKLLNGSDTTQNTNALQYALNFKGEN